MQTCKWTRSLCTSMLFAGLALFATSTARAATVFTTADSPFMPGTHNQGFWESGGLGSGPTNDNYMVGFTGDTLYHNFFTFDLSSFTGTAASATLELVSADTYSDDPVLTYGLFDVTTDAETLNTHDDIDMSGILSDLGSNVSYGQFEVNTLAQPEILELQLNASAIADINRAAGGYFSIGGSILHGSGTLFAGSNGLTQRLIVTTAPIPAAFWLFGSALIGFFGLRRWKKATS